MGKQDQYPSTKEILYLLGMGTLLTAAVVMPGLGVAAGQLYRAKRKYDWEQSQKAWKKFNLNYLRRNIKRLHQQKMVEVTLNDGQEVLKLTQKGKTQYLKFKFEELSLKGKSWDGKWRLVVYDIQKSKLATQHQFRRILKYIKFLPLQKSVYLTPYPCKEEIEYLRQYFDISQETMIMEVVNLENEKLYKEYFGL